MDNRNEKLAHNLIYNSISLNGNENILVEVIGKDGLELANEIIKQAKIINAKPHLNIINYEDLRDFLINATKEDIIEYGKKDYEIMKKMQAYIGISTPTSDNSLKGVSQEKLDLYNRYYTALVHLEQRVKHTKWCILRYPNEYFAKKSNMTLNEFKDFYYNVCNVDYNKMKIVMEPLKELMNKTDKVHIVAPGTDLTFSIKGIPAEKYYGTFNIPDGEVATCPVNYLELFKYPDFLYDNYRNKIRYNEEDFPNATKFYNQIIKLPVWEGKDDEEIVYKYIRAIKKEANNIDEL